MSVQQIKLRSINEIDKSKRRSKISRLTRDIPRQQNAFTNQMFPQDMPSLDQQRNRQDQQKTMILNKKGGFMMIEDPRKSRFSHSKLLAIQKISFMITVMIFFLSVLKTQVDILQLQSRYLATCIMNTISLFTFTLMIILTLRYICLFELWVDQKKIFLVKEKNKWWLTTFFRKSHDLPHLFLEMLIVLPHPVSILDGYKLSIMQTYNQIMLVHQVNDMLAILLLMKIYIIIRSLVNVTIYASPRSSRLCHQNGINHNLLYTVKCILNEQPLSAILIIFIILMLVFGNGLKLSEGVLFLNNQGNYLEFKTYTNCFWCVFITMATVGYGDSFPKTLPGRCILFTTSISGVLLSSLLIVSLSAYLQMQPSEDKSHIALLRLCQQAQLNKEAKQAMAQTIRIANIMKSTNNLAAATQMDIYSDRVQMDNLSQENSSNCNSPQGMINLSHASQQCPKKQSYESEGLRQAFIKLKKKIDTVKMRSRQIKSLVDTNNIIQEMNKLFYILKDNLKMIYSKQQRIKREIEKIELPECIKLSFVKEVSQMLAKHQC